MTENEISRCIVTSAIQIHRKLGPGLYESVYECTLANDLRASGLRVEQQKILPVTIEGVVHKRGFRADLIVDNKVIVEVKAVTLHLQIHRSQMLTYLRCSGYRLGMILNFGLETMKQGISRVVNGLAE
jgi:GxxExxY protein